MTTMTPWQNPGPVARYCTGCGCPMICGRQVTAATTAAEMDDTNTWAMCPVCGATLIDILAQAEQERTEG